MLPWRDETEYRPILAQPHGLPVHLDSIRNPGEYPATLGVWFQGHQIDMKVPGGWNAGKSGQPRAGPPSQRLLLAGREALDGGGPPSRLTHPHFADRDPVALLEHTIELVALAGDMPRQERLSLGEGEIPDHHFAPMPEGPACPVRGRIWMQMPVPHGGSEGKRGFAEDPGLKGSPVMRRRTQRPEGVNLLRGVVPLVTSEAIGRMPEVEGGHVAIPEHLRNDRGGSNSGALGVSFDHRLLRAAIPGESLIAINQHQGWCLPEARNRPFHRQEGCPEDVDLVDSPRIDPRNAEGQRLLTNAGKKSFALLMGELLGVAEPFEGRVRMQDHGGSYDRTCQGPASDFIDSTEGARGHQGRIEIAEGGPATGYRSHVT
ncbi:MAG: hypothetical protein GEEBNDBF_01498 [bacterium]|nr:hypothetical protein [bacterium]